MYNILIFSALLGFSSFCYGRNCGPTQYVVSGHARSGYNRSDGTYVKPTTVKTYCKDLSKAAVFVMSGLKKEMPQKWPFKSEKKAPWLEYERERLIEALDRLPEQLFADKKISFHRLKKSKDYPNPATSADGIIVLYDNSFSHKKGLERILAHELAHQMFRNFSANEKQGYGLGAGWDIDLDKSGMIYWTPPKGRFVEEDGKSSYEEDFANNLEYYMFESDKLKEVSPKAHEWLKAKFGNKLALKKASK